ncbi:hypothetical protein RDWZM_001598 [Blomia tropicalis]|uniref:Uncharacterized protein n=1 Tax=Blomia tropicalis TaxID=40697 RepID=A0A9Q0MAY0_BLOTA|nr:hypothetical protein RDWZM_001598 [Blomia tropicalis]
MIVQNCANALTLVVVIVVVVVLTWNNYVSVRTMAPNVRWTKSPTTTRLVRNISVSSSFGNVWLPSIEDERDQGYITFTLLQ